MRKGQYKRCGDCRQEIEFDTANKRHWDAWLRPTHGHPMFETRAMIESRKGEDG